MEGIFLEFFSYSLSLRAMVIHGGKSQDERDYVIRGFYFLSF